MRVLLTGASGFVGRHVLQVLARHRIEVVVTGRRPPHGPHHAFIPADLLQPGAGPAAVRQAGASHLLHLAWYAEHGKFWQSPLNQAWAQATQQLVSAFCEAGGRHVVAAGSCAEYAWSDQPLDELETPCTPASLYGACKLSAGAQARETCAHHAVSLAWARLFFLTGPGEAPGRLVPSLARVFRGELPAFSVDAHARRDLLHVDDVASALVHLVQAGADGTFNVASGLGTPVGDLVCWVAAACGQDPTGMLALAAARPGEPRSLVGRNTRLLATGWQPCGDLRAAITRDLGA